MFSSRKTNIKNARDNLARAKTALQNLLIALRNQNHLATQVLNAQREQQQYADVATPHMKEANIEAMKIALRIPDSKDVDINDQYAFNFNLAPTRKLEADLELIANRKDVLERIALDDAIQIPAVRNAVDSIRRAEEQLARAEADYNALVKEIYNPNKPREANQRIKQLTVESLLGDKDLTKLQYAILSINIRFIYCIATPLAIIADNIEYYGTKALNQAFKLGQDTSANISYAIKIFCDKISGRSV